MLAAALTAPWSPRSVDAERRVPPDDLPAAVAPRPDVRHVHLVAEVAAVESGDLAVARDEHGRVAVDLGVDLLVRELVDLVGPARGGKERVTVELPGRALQRELRSEHLLERTDIVLGHRARELVGELDELVAHGRRHPVSILSGDSLASSNAYRTTGSFAALTSSSRRTGRVSGACLRVSGSFAASSAIERIAATNSSSRSFVSVSVGSIISASWTTSGK